MVVHALFRKRASLTTKNDTYETNQMVENIKGTKKRNVIAKNSIVVNQRNINTKNDDAMVDAIDMVVDLPLSHRNRPLNPILPTLMFRLWIVLMMIMSPAESILLPRGIDILVLGTRVMKGPKGTKELGSIVLVIVAMMRIWMILMMVVVGEIIVVLERNRVDDTVHPVRLRDANVVVYSLGLDLTPVLGRLPCCHQSRMFIRRMSNVGGRRRMGKARGKTRLEIGIAVNIGVDGTTNNHLILTGYFYFQIKCLHIIIHKQCFGDTKHVQSSPTNIGFIQFVQCH